jgi:hypothetical protein
MLLSARTPIALITPKACAITATTFLEKKRKSRIAHTQTKTPTAKECAEIATATFSTSAERKKDYKPSRNNALRTKSEENRMVHLQYSVDHQTNFN